MAWAGKGGRGGGGGEGGGGEGGGKEKYVVVWCGVVVIIFKANARGQEGGG